MKSLVTLVEKRKYFLEPWSRFRNHCQDMRLLWRKEGFKALIKRYGWKFFAVVFFYYLIRDIFLYILLPYFIIKQN